MSDSRVALFARILLVCGALPSAAQPRAVVESSPDLGWAWRGDEISHQLELRNDGDHPLEIRGFRSVQLEPTWHWAENRGWTPGEPERVLGKDGPCVFTDPERVVPPGGSTLLTVHCRTERLGRRPAVEVFLLTNDPHLPPWKDPDGPATVATEPTTGLPLVLRFEVRDRFALRPTGEEVAESRGAEPAEGPLGLEIGPLGTASFVLWARDGQDLTVVEALFEPSTGEVLPAACTEALDVSYREARPGERSPEGPERQWWVQIRQTIDPIPDPSCSEVMLRLETDHPGQSSFGTLLELRTPRAAGPPEQ